MSDIFFDTLDTVYRGSPVDRIYTPFNICRDMFELLEDAGFFRPPMYVNEDYINSHRVIDIYCKSGNFLMIAYYKFDVALSYAIPQQTIRDRFILENLLYGICPNKYAQSAIAGRLYERICYGGVGNIMCGNLLDEGFEGRFKDMRFDVVVGNPPYNDDIYLKFVEKGNQMAERYSLWITPAKWQARQYFDAKFREIFNNISSVVYYIDTDEVFKSVREWGGVSYYLINKSKCDSINITTKCKRNEKLELSLKAYDLNKGLHVYAFGILSKVSKSGFDRKSNFSRFSLNDGKNGRYMTILPNTYSTTSGRLSDDGAYFVLSPLYVDTLASGDNNKPIFRSDDISKCNNVSSYFSTRFIRFLMHLSLCKQHPLSNKRCDDTFLFVPKLHSLDIMYEDRPLDGYTPDDNGEYIDSNGCKHCSLYVKYKLTDAEIDIIESVIRERK